MRFSFLVRASSAAVLVALSFASSTAAQTDHADGNGAVVDLSRIRINNFGRINASYYRGEQPEGRDYADLAAQGVRTVIDLQQDGENFDEARLVEEAGMKFHRIPMTTHVPPTPEQVSSFLGIVNDLNSQPVYVHCAGGRHRTGVMTAVYRMENDGWTADQAFREMKQYKFGPDFLHTEFKRFVYSYRALLKTPVSPVLALTTAPG
jgi:protein tyrosine/serine phosphatase